MQAARGPPRGGGLQVPLLGMPGAVRAQIVHAVLAQIAELSTEAGG